jgi:hypothetical protein
MDARQKAKDLLRLALNEGTNEQERNAATIQLLRLLDKYDLLGGKPINVASNILEQIMNPDFMDSIAGRVEKFASGVERVMAAGKRVTDRVGVAHESATREPRRRSRRYR